MCVLSANLTSCSYCVCGKDNLIIKKLQTKLTFIVKLFRCTAYLQHRLDVYTFTFFTRVTPTFDMFRHGKPRGTSLVFRIYINHSAGKLFGTLLSGTYLVVFKGLDISLVVLYSGFNVTFNSIFRTKLDCSACRLFLHS